MAKEKKSDKTEKRKTLREVREWTLREKRNSVKRVG